MGKWKRGDFVAHRVDCHNRSYKRKINKLSPIYSKNKVCYLIIGNRLVNIMYSSDNQTGVERLY